MAYSNLEPRRKYTIGLFIINCVQIIMANVERAKLEDLNFQTEMINRPLPTTLGEYKNHPL